MIEYPKCLYQADGQTLVVSNEEEEDSAAGMGWMTAEKFHSKNQPAEKPVVEDKKK